MDRGFASGPVDPTELMELLLLMKSKQLPAVREEEVLDALQAMHSHPLTLQCSFQLKSDHAATAASDMDFSLVRAFYDRILALRDREVDDVILQSVRRLLCDTDFNRSHAPVSRALLILLFCPLVMDALHRGILVHVLHTIRALDDSCKSDLQRFLKQLTTEHMTYLLESLQQFLTIIILNDSVVQDEDLEDVVDVMDVLSLLFDANQTSRVVQHEAFYNSAINSSEFNIDADFKNWFGYDDALPFSFCNYPFVYDSGSKSRIMQLENIMTQDQELEGAFWRCVAISDDFGENPCPYLLLRVRRGQYLLQDAIDHISAARERQLLKCPLKVQFVGEEGVDEGGLAKEFFHLVLKQLFDPDYGMFIYDDQTRFWWFRSSSAMNLEREFELAGTLLGLALFNNHILDLHFPLVMYKKLLGYNLEMEDLKDIYPDIYRSLKWLLEMESGVTSLGLYFVVDHDTGLGERTSVDLIHDGRNIKVTRCNRFQFVRLYTKFLLETSIESQFNAFRSGFLSICLSCSLQMFLPEELEQAVCGRRVIDLLSLEAHARYMGGYRPSSRVIRWFWEFAHQLSEERKQKLLSFVTGSNRVPFRGFGDLVPCFTITREPSQPLRLPTAHTCFNLLHLPEYPSHDVLNRQMETAIDNAEGFGLV